MADTVIPIVSRRHDRAAALDKVPHLVGALALFGDAMLRVRGDFEPYGWGLAAAEAVTSALVFAGVAHAVWNLLGHAGGHRGGGSGASTSGSHAAKTMHVESRWRHIDWVDLAMALMLAVEAVAHHDETRYWPRPTMLTAAMLLVWGVIHHPVLTRIRARRGLAISSKGMRIGSGLSGFAAGWGDLEPIQVTEHMARIRTIDGRERRIDFHQITNVDEIRNALREAEILRTAKRRFQDTKGPRLIERPTVIQSAGNKPKTIEEYAGLVNSGHRSISVARMVSPEGWVEPGQRPEFEEITVVLRGLVRVEHRAGSLDVRAGQAVVTPPGSWIRYSSPDPGGAEYVAICLPAFSPATVHRDAE